MTSMLSPRLKCREATHNDYDAVIKMASVDTFRDGFDYLPAKFHQYVDDQDVYVFVAESDGKVVSNCYCLCFMKLDRGIRVVTNLAVYVSLTTDDGAYLLNHTLRIAPELQGKKLVKTFLRALDQALLRHYPQLKRCERHGLSDTRRPYMWSYIPKTDICFIDIMYFQGTSNAVLDHLKTSKVLPSSPLPTVVPYQPTDLKRLSGPGFSDQFLNDKIIWIPYKLSARNLRRFSDRVVRILVDTCQPTAKSLSFGGGYMTPRGRLYHVDVHCKDVSLCQAHIKNHVDRACLEYEGVITFCVMLIDQSLKITSKTFCMEAWKSWLRC
ncbi:PREDICTED: histidine N-acetyltransferase-like [Branchiostoma belcheri]|uniref:Histidine N-acetyltransferase-like n=1 Tax=Branchiostoma belcheri TaxID=7741 RepID=A0A6P4YWM2_BRABE|nr:PREDICTED: histidine N-acetyltransferase-like [Branchiostoma belcheri]